MLIIMQYFGNTTIKKSPSYQLLLLYRSYSTSKSRKNPKIRFFQKIFFYRKKYLNAIKTSILCINYTISP